MFCDDSCSSERSWLIIGILGGEREQVKRREGAGEEEGGVGEKEREGGSGL